MNNIDIRRNILYNINNAELLSQVCQADKLSQLICSDKYFWSLYYSKYNLPLPHKDYNTSAEWIKSFVVSKKTKELLQYLDESYIHDEDYSDESDILHQIYIYPTDMDIDVYLTGKIDKDKKIIEFMNKTIDFIDSENMEPTYQIDITKKENSYDIFYILYDENHQNIIDDISIQLNNVKDVYKLIYNLLYSDAGYETGEFHY